LFKSVLWFSRTYPTYHHSRYSGTVFSCFVEEWLPNAGDVVKAVKKWCIKNSQFKWFDI
jgi:hypothetical protein